MKSKVRERKKKMGKGAIDTAPRKKEKVGRDMHFTHTRCVFVSCEAMRVVHIRPPGLQDQTTGRGGT